MSKLTKSLKGRELQEYLKKRFTDLKNELGEDYAIHWRDGTTTFTDTDGKIKTKIIEK